MNSIKSYLFIGFFSVSIGASAQIPSASFEDWGKSPFESLETWETLGNVSKSYVRSEGDFAIRLDNILDSEIEIGVVTNADLESDFEGGFEYEDRPFSVEFDAKYDLADGDTAQILVYFKYEQNAVGIMDFRLSESSADTFTSFTVPISWFGFVNPDSVIIAIASASFEDEINGNGFLIVDDFKFSSLGTPDASVPNQGFDSWVVEELEHPNGWYTTDLIVKEIFGETPNPSIVSRNSDAFHGDYALQLSNFGDGDDITPGVALTGKSFDDLATPTIKVSANHSYLRGMYKYSPDQNDIANVMVMMFSEGVPVAAGEIDINQEETEWTPFEVEIEYSTTLSVDSAFIMISNSDFDDPKGEDTRLWIDNLKFVDYSLGITELTNNQSIIPNPFNNYFQINTNEESFKVQLIDMNGRQVYQTTNQKEIKTDQLAPGVYFIQYRSQHQSWQKKIVKQ